MKKFNEFIKESIGVFSNKENEMVGQDVTIITHRMSNDGRMDLFNQVGRVSDVNENGSYLVRMLMDGDLYTFTSEQVKVMEMVKVKVMESLNESYDYKLCSSQISVLIKHLQHLDKEIKSKGKDDKFNFESLNSELAKIGNKISGIYNRFKISTSTKEDKKISGYLE